MSRFFRQSAWKQFNSYMFICRPIASAFRLLQPLESDGASTKGCSVPMDAERSRLATVRVCICDKTRKRLEHHRGRVRRSRRPLTWTSLMYHGMSSSPM